jgi:hypothetical protein
VAELSSRIAYQMATSTGAGWVRTPVKIEIPVLSCSVGLPSSKPYSPIQMGTLMPFWVMRFFVLVAAPRQMPPQ